MNLATKLTVSRMLLVPFMAAAFYITFPGNYAVAAAIFVIAGATDFLDGYFARKHNQVSDLGKFLDPIADKVLAAVTIFIVLDGGMLPDIWGALAAGIMISREMLISGLRQIAAVKGKVLAADKAGKAKTLVLNIALPVLMLAPYSEIVMYVGWGLFALSFVLTVYSGVRYMLRNKEVFAA